MNTKATIKFFWQQVWEFKWWTIGVLIATPLAMLVHTFIASLIVSNILDKLARGDYEPGNLLSSFGELIILYIITYLIGNVFLYRLVTYLEWQLTMRASRSIAIKTFNHLVSLDLTFHTNHFGGSLVSQTDKLIGAYQRFFDTIIHSLLPLVSVIVFTAIVLIPRVPLYIPILLVLSGGYLAVAIFSSRHIRRFNIEDAQANTRQTGLLADSITNIFTIKGFARDRYEQQRFAEAADETMHASSNLLKAALHRDTYFSLVGSCFSIAAVITSIASVMYFQATIGTAFLMLAYSLAIAQRLWDFSSLGLRNYNQAIGDAHDMLEILHQQPAVLDAPIPTRPSRQDIGITFRNVGFTHAGTNSALFQDFSLTVAPGEKVGIVGRSGAGKSTLTRLLLRFADVDKGEILLGDHAITALQQKDLREQIAYVPQESLLFHRSIKENIEYGKLNATSKDIRQAASQAHALEFIEKLPRQFHTLVGERGVKLSGGQRQRIAIARAILKDAPILVLDEATAALDSESEKLIQQSLDVLMKDRTSLVIAHRLSTIAKLDRIIVLEDGRIAEEGTHQNLLEKRGIYASLWEHQSGGFIEE